MWQSSVEARTVTYLPDVVAPYGEVEIVGVMATNRWKATVVFSSDHLGINRELARLEREMLHVLAHLDDARKVKLYADYLRVASTTFCEMEHVDLRGWMERGRKRVA